MTKLNVEMEKIEPEIVTVAKVIRRYIEGKAEFPGIEFIDTERRRQNIPYLESVSRLDYFKRIVPGSQFKVTKVVRVSAIILLPPKKN